MDRASRMDKLNDRLMKLYIKEVTDGLVDPKVEYLNDKAIFLENKVEELETELFHQKGKVKTLKELLRESELECAKLKPISFKSKERKKIEKKVGSLSSLKDLVVSKMDLKLFEMITVTFVNGSHFLNLVYDDGFSEKGTIAYVELDSYLEPGVPQIHMVECISFRKDYLKTEKFKKVVLECIKENLKEG